MTSRTAWTGGNLNSGLTWTTLINSADFASLANGSTVLSTLTAVLNGTGLDQFMDVSLRASINTTTLAAGASCTLYLMYALDNGTTFGDGSIVTAGTTGAISPPPTVFPSATFNFRAVATTIALNGFAGGILIQPGSFIAALQNNSGTTLSSSTTASLCLYRTYNQNLNN